MRTCPRFTQWSCRLGQSGSNKRSVCRGFCGPSCKDLSRRHVYASVAMASTIPVHHMRAHILAHVLEPGTPPKFPFLCLTVSGGHTQLVLVQSPGNMEVLGQTLDDAAGEAFDKVAKLIGLPYPGGPLVDKLAASGNPEACSFSRPRMDGYNWSFS